MSTYRDLLRQPRVGRLLSAYTVSSVGTAMDEIAIVWAARGLTDRPALAIAFATASFLAPGVLLSLVLGSRLSRVRPTLMVALHGTLMFVALTAAAFMLASGYDDLTTFCALLAIAGILAPTGRSAFRIILRDVTPAEDYYRANSMVSAVAQATFLGGPALAGLLIAVQGPELVLLLDAVSCLVLALAVIGIPNVHRSPGGTDAAPSDLETTNTRDLRIAWLVVIGTTGFYLLYAPMVVSLPLLLSSRFDFSEAQAASALGFAWSALGVGAIIVTLLAGSRHALVRADVAIAIIGLWGVATLVVAASPTFAVLLLGMFIGGVAFAPYASISYTLLQEQLPDGAYRVFNLRLTTAMTGSQPVGLLLAGVVAASLGASTALYGAALGLIVLSGVLWVALTTMGASGRDASPA